MGGSDLGCCTLAKSLAAANKVSLHSAAGTSSTGQMQVSVVPAGQVNNVGQSEPRGMMESSVAPAGQVDEVDEVEESEPRSPLGSSSCGLSLTNFCWSRYA